MVPASRRPCGNERVLVVSARAASARVGGGVGPAGQGTDRGDELGVGGVQIGLGVAAEHLGDTGVGRRHHASEHRGLEHDANVGARGAVADSARVELGELIEHAVEDRDEGAVRRRTATTTAPTTR